MTCPHCSSPTTPELTRKTQLAYRMFRCRDCGRTFNERTGTPFNYLEFPTDIVLLVVMWRLRYTLSLRDLAEMFLERGFEFTHEAVRARGRPASRRSWRTKCGLSAKAKSVARGMSTKRTSASVASGNTCIGRLIAKAIWSTRC